MKELSKTKKRIISLITAVVITVSGVAVFMNREIIAEALFDPKTAVTFSQFKNSTTIDDSVIFIGTYIIHKDALTSVLYDKAQTSASESGQNDMYYKSELSDGQWFDIGDSDNGLDDISSMGVPVDEAVLDPLYVSYYAGADGILRDAKTLLPVNTFDIPDPYDLSKLPELQPLWLQYTYSESTENISQAEFLKNRNSDETGKLRSDVYYYQLLSTFFSLDVRDAETNKCDEDLVRLNGCYINLKAAGQDEEAALVYGLMEKVDAKRRMIVMDRLAVMEPNLLSTMNTLATGSNYTPYGNFKDSSNDANRYSNPDYINELEDSLKHDFTTQGLSISNPIINIWFQRLGVKGNSSGWWTVLGTDDDKARKRSEEANKENDDWWYDETPRETPFTPDTSLTEAIGTCLSNCNDSYTSHMGKCLVDNNSILGHAEYDYSTQVIDSSSSSGLGGPVTYLKHVVNIRDNVVSDKEGELSFLKSSLIPQADSAYTQHASAGPNSDYASLASDNAKTASLEDQKASLEADRSDLQFFIDGVRQRDTAANALAFVYERLTIAENLNDSIPDSAFKPFAKSSVEAHIVWLKEEAQRIIDSDESLKSEADRLKDKKGELQKKRDGALDDNDLAGAKAYDALIDAVDKDIADASGSGSGSGADSLADSLVDKAMDKLADNANADLSGVADALAAMGATDALDALKDKAAASGAGAGTLKGIQNAIDSAGAGSGKNTATEDSLLSELENLFGKSLDEMDDRELAIATATMSRLGRSGIEPAESLAAKLVNRLIAKNNKYTYKQYTSDRSLEFVSLKTVSDCTSYRYFYDENKATGTMTSGTTIYIFKRGSDQMYKQSTDNPPETMSDSSVTQGALMLSETDTSKYFGCITEYCIGTDYAVCLTGPMQSAVDNYVEALTEFFKGE